MLGLQEKALVVFSVSSAAPMDICQWWEAACAWLCDPQKPGGYQKEDTASTVSLDLSEARLGEAIFNLDDFCPELLGEISCLLPAAEAGKLHCTCSTASKAEVFWRESKRRTGNAVSEPPLVAGFRTGIPRRKKKPAHWCGYVGIFFDS